MPQAPCLESCPAPSALTRRGIGAALLAAAGAGPARALTVTDGAGARVEVPDHPQRLAAISYLGVDVALALGIMPVATTYMTAGRHPDFLLGLTARMAQIGQRARPNLELLSQARPDLIVAMRRYTAGNAEQLRLIAPLLSFNMELLSESYTEVAVLCRVLGNPARGEALNASFRAAIEDAARRAPAGPGPRFQVMWAGDAPFSFHTENTAASIVAALGGQNIAGPMTQGGRFGLQLSLEAMLERDPQVIFVYDSGPDRPHEANPIWRRLSAVRAGRVHYVGDHWVESNGPIARLVVLREAAHFLYADRFPAIDVKAEAARLIPASLQG